MVLSPYLGPLIASFVVASLSWEWAFWLCAILTGIAIVLAFCLDETLFDRSMPADPRVPRGPFIWRLLGVEQARSWKQRSLFESLMRPAVAITKLPVLFVTLYYFLVFAWVVGVNTTISIYHLLLRFQLARHRLLLLLRHRGLHFGLGGRTLASRYCR